MEKRSPLQRQRVLMKEGIRVRLPKWGLGWGEIPLNWNEKGERIIFRAERF